MTGTGRWNAPYLAPQNNLADVPVGATALANLGISADQQALLATTSTAAELNLLDNACATVTFAAAAGAANVMVVTLTVKDAAGATIAAHQRLEVYITESAAGLGLTGDTISGDATWGSNEEIDEVTSKKRFRILTAATGIATLSIEDSAKPADQRLAVVHPLTGKLIVSGALNAWGA
jgi:hypothetical protein